MTDPSAVVLILAPERDGTSDLIAAELASRGVPVARMDTADFPVRSTLAAEIGGDRERWGGTLRAVTDTGRAASIELDQVRSVWYRHPSQFDLPEGMSETERVFAYNEARRGFGGVLQSLDCLWVNDPVHAARAEYKPAQLRAAGESGLRVPRTLITNDADEAYEWSGELARPFCYKTLSSTWHAEEGRLKVIYTNPVDREELREGGIEHTAHLFQEWVDTAYEARAIVVGDQVFTTAIYAGSEAGQTDWRADYDSNRYKAVEPPDAVRDGLVRLHRNRLPGLGLAYGACDLGITPEGEWIFYETNPAGQFEWLTGYGAAPVPGAIADLLEKGQNETFL